MGILTGQTAIVTGASKGIGRAIVEALGAEGAQVVGMARNGADLDKFLGEMRARGYQVVGESGDVGNERDVRRVVDRAAGLSGSLSIVVNNAGVGVFKPVTDLAIEEFDRMWSTNMRGVFLMCKNAIPHLITRGGGHVINIGSLAGKNSFKGGAGYCSTKWALRGFSSSLMLEVREHHIRVTTIFPGSVETGFSMTGKKGETITQPEDVASAVLFAVSAPPRSMFSEIDLRPTNPR